MVMFNSVGASATYRGLVVIRQKLQELIAEDGETIAGD
jgi:hypothetical protein